MQIAPKDGVNYFHRSFSDTDHLRPYGKHQSPPYPRSHDPMYKAGGSLNRILRHQIGRSEHPQSRHRTIKCNEGGWVLLEDLLLIDGIWHDGEKYDHNKSRNPNYAMKIAAKRTGWIVSLTVGEARTKGKNRFQILSLRATDNEEVIQAIKQYEITPPLPGDDVVKNYDGWLMPIAVRATSGHSMDNSSMVPINPYSFIRRLDLKSALQLQGAFHVTSPQNLKSILKYGIVPGGNERNRLMTYFGVFAPWDARNRCTRHKSPYEGDDYMVVIYIPPSELSRFGAGVSGNGDILVDKIIPPEEIKEIWIAMNCRPERDEQGYWRNVVTRPWKIFSKKLDDEIVTYSDFQKLGRSGIIAPREQIIDGAEQLIKRFPRAPVGDPDDLEELKEDVKTLKSTRGTLKLENETRARVVMKLALYQKSAGNQTLGVRNIKCPCCLQETTSCLAISKGNIKTIPLKDMFFVGQVTCDKDWGRGVGTVTLIMNRKDGKADRKFKFESNDEDFELVKLLGDRKEERTQQNIVTNMWEIADDIPRLVLLCSEESNWFTTMNAKRQEKLGRREGVGEISTAVITITIHDDLNSDYGLHKAALSLRDERDTMFFAGPCTGGSSWARLNRARGPSTEAIIDAKVEIFQRLWNRFETLFIAHYDKGIGIYMELPRGCQYWKNDDVKFMIEGTISKIHDFDGCCYGLRQKFGDNNMYINKPWRIVSWNVKIGNKLSLKCDGRHEHAPCAGRETIHTHAVVHQQDRFHHSG